MGRLLVALLAIGTLAVAACGATATTSGERDVSAAILEKDGKPNTLAFVDTAPESVAPRVECRGEGAMDLAMALTEAGAPELAATLEVLDGDPTPDDLAAVMAAMPAMRAALADDGSRSCQDTVDGLQNRLAALGFGTVDPNAVPFAGLDENLAAGYGMDPELAACAAQQLDDQAKGPDPGTAPSRGSRATASAEASAGDASPSELEILAAMATCLEAP